MKVEPFLLSALLLSSVLFFSAGASELAPALSTPVSSPPVTDSGRLPAGEKAGEKAEDDQLPPAEAPESCTLEACSIGLGKVITVIIVPEGD